MRASGCSPPRWSSEVGTTTCAATAGSRYRRTVEGTEYEIPACPTVEHGYRNEVEEAIGRPLLDREWWLVRSDEDHCATCGMSDHYKRAKAAARKPGAVVATNHSIVAYDVRFGGSILGIGGEDVLLLDEGHQVPDAFRDALGATITPRRFALLRAAHVEAVGWDDIGDAGERALAAFLATFDVAGSRRDYLQVLAPSAHLEDAIEWANEVRDSAAETGRNAEEDSPRAKKLSAVAQRAERLAADLMAAQTGSIDPDVVVWVELVGEQRRKVLQVRPLDVKDFAQTVIGRPGAALTMSATLAGQPLADIGAQPSR